MKTNRYIIPVILLALLVSCSLNNEVGIAEDNSSVLFNIVSNGAKQKLYLYRTANVNETINRREISGEGYGKFAIKNANIILKNSNLSFPHFVLEDDSTYYEKGYCYVNSTSLNILPNQEYLLEINFDDETIFGETTTPGDFKIIYPKNNVIIKAKDDEYNVSFRVNWSKSNNAKGYIITITSMKLYGSSYSFITGDTTFQIKRYMSWGKYKLEVLAYDKNFHKYIVEEYNQSGLENAYGYFGSSVLRSINFTVVY